jgi:predicted secreted protein
MSTGFIAYNNSGDVLVSSDTKNLHFIQKITTPTSLEETSDYHGGIRRWIYRATCSVTPVPFFTTPTSDYYAISRIKSAGTNLWDIEVIRSGTSSTTPDVYIFAEPSAASSTDTYGMVVYMDDGSAAFDSRLRPLAVTGGLSVTHPSNPRSSYSTSGLSAKNCSTSVATYNSNFIPTESNTYQLSGQSSKPMFCYLSLAQSEREIFRQESEEECDGFDYGTCIGSGRFYYWDSTYWAFYRGGIKFTNDAVSAGWIVVDWGCNWVYRKDSNILGIGTGGGGGSGGDYPYSNETINTAAVSLIAGDASRYD